MTSYDSAAGRGVRAAQRVLDQELRIQERHRASVMDAARYHSIPHLMLNLGCGDKHREGWVNIDLRDDADLQLDLRENFPFLDESTARIYSEHLLEHLVYPGEVEHLLRESFRVLEPGGVFSVGVPDAEETLVQYAAGELPALIEKWSAEPYLRWFPAWVWSTPMHLVNFFFRQDGEHKHAYDFSTLSYVLAEAGFADIRRREFAPGLDSPDRRDGTLYVDCRKPPG